MATTNNTGSQKPPSPTSPQATTSVPPEIAPLHPKSVAVSTTDPERKNSNGETGSTSKRKPSPEISTVQPSKRAHITQCKAKITQVGKQQEGQLVYKHAAESVEYEQMIIDRLDTVIGQQLEINRQISTVSTNISKIALLLSRLQQH